MNSKVSRLPDEIYLEIFSLSGISPLRLRISKYVERLVLRYLPVPDNKKFIIYETLILFNRLDLIKLYAYNVPPNVTGIQRGKMSLYPDYMFWKNSKKITPMGLASKFCRCGIVRYFLSFPKNIVCSLFYLKSLKVAIKHGYIPIVLMLLNNNNASIMKISELRYVKCKKPTLDYHWPGLRRPHGTSSDLLCELVEAAINKKQTTILEILLKSNKIKYENAFYEYILPFYAINKNNVDALRLLLKYSHYKSNYHKYIYEASKCKSPDILMFLINDLHMDPSVDNNQAIIIASEHGNIEVVKFLLSDKRVDPSAQHNEAVYQAYMNGHIDIYNLLQEHGCRPITTTVD